MRIEDGQGKGFVAGVSDEFRLRTESISSSIEHHVNHVKGQAYNLIFSATPTAGDDCVLYIENSSLTDIVIEGFCISNSAACELYIKLGAEGNRNAATTITPTNLNAGKGSSALGFFEQGSDLNGGTATLSGGVEAMRVVHIEASGSRFINFEQDIIIPRFRTFTLWCDTPAVVLKGIVSFNYHNEEF